MEISFGKTSDIDSWMELVTKVKDDFPGLETREALKEHRRTVLEFIDKESAICAKYHNKIVGVLLFSKEHHMICFLAVDMAYRRQHIAENMVSYMLTVMDQKKISWLQHIGRAYQKASLQGHFTSDAVL